MGLSWEPPRAAAVPCSAPPPALRVCRASGAPWTRGPLAPGACARPIQPSLVPGSFQARPQTQVATAAAARAWLRICPMPARAKGLVYLTNTQCAPSPCPCALAPAQDWDEYCRLVPYRIIPYIY
jgi:hypothetical protein